MSIPRSALGNTDPVTQLICNDVKGIVEQQQYVFDTLRDKAILAERKT
ncbi:MAG: hypothetical protein WAZ77_09350 [Candidatus Nitrosopolaris sp.]